MSSRDEVLNYLTSLKLKNFKVSSELPFLPNGTPLHIKNPKTIYVGAEQISFEPFIKLFNRTIDQEIVTIAIYLTTDAKQQPQDYGTTVGRLQAAKEVGSAKYFDRTSDMTTDYQDDLLITQIEIRLARVIN